MIVQPDFADHWKTELLVRVTCSESSVRCLIRFWAHCQQRRMWRFKNLTPEILAGICKWSGDPQLFWSAMLQTFLDHEETGEYVAHEWEEVNCRLVHNWDAGKRGGRPKKNPRDNPVETLGEPLENPRVSQGKPKDNPRGNPAETEKRREEKIGEDQTGDDEIRELPSSGKPDSAAAKKSKLSDEEFVKALKENPAYQGIDIDREIGKARAWLMTPKGKGRQMTRGFIVNWLNKADAPVHINGNGHSNGSKGPDFSKGF